MRNEVGQTCSATGGTSRGSPFGLFRENMTSRSFQTGSKRKGSRERRAGRWAARLMKSIRAVLAVRPEADGLHAEAIAKWKHMFMSGFPRGTEESRGAFLSRPLTTRFHVR